MLSVMCRSVCHILLVYSVLYSQILATENESLHQQIQEQKSALQQQKLGVMDTSLKMKYESQISSLQKHVQLLESQKNVGHVNGAALDNLNGASCPGVDAMGNAALQAELQSVRAQCKTITEERDQIVSKMQLDYDVMLKTKEDQFNELSEATNSLYADYAEEVQALKNENKRKISVFFLRKEPERYAVLCKASFYKWKGMSTSYKLQKSQTKIALDAVSTVKSTPLSVPLAPRTPSLGSSDSKPPPPVTNAGAFCTLCGTSEHVISTGFGSDFESGDQVDMSAATIQKDDLLTYLPVAPGTPSALTHAYASDKNKEFVMRDPRIPVSQSRPGLECRETRTNSNASVTSTSSSPLVSNEDSVEDLFWMVVIKFLIWLLLLLGAYYVLETYTEVSNVSPNSSVPNRFYNLVLNACNRRCYMESDVGQDDCVMNYLTGSDYQVHADSGLDEMRFCTSFSGLSSVAVTILHMLQMVAIECFNMFALGKAMLKGNSMTILGNQTVSMYLSTSLKTVGSTLVEMAHLVGVCLATLLLDLLCSAHHYVLTYYRVTS